MKKTILIFLLLLLSLILSTSSISQIPVDLVKIKLKGYAEANLRDSLSYSSFDIASVEKFGDYVVINVKINGKSARWFKATKDFNRITK